MLGRRIGRRGLLRAAATTAVVAGTATAVSGGIQSRNAARSQQAAEADAYEQQQQQAQIDTAAQEAVYAQQATAPPTTNVTSNGDDLMAQIQSLATMHSQGILSDFEFAAAKAKLLA